MKCAHGDNNLQSLKQVTKSSEELRAHKEQGETVMSSSVISTVSEGQENILTLLVTSNNNFDSVKSV